MKESATIGLYALLAIFGGVMGYVVRTLDQNLPVKPWRVVIEGAAAGFVGILVTLLCNSLNLSPQITGVTVGVFGWLGASSTIRVLEKIVIPRIGGKSPTQEE